MTKGDSIDETCKMSNLSRKDGAKEDLWKKLEYSSFFIMGRTTRKYNFVRSSEIIEAMRVVYTHVIGHTKLTFRKTLCKKKYAVLYKYFKTIKKTFNYNSITYGWNN